MARVVQRRNAPPYLLIVFVFLFLISAILAVLGFMGSGDEKKENINLKSRVSDLRRENDVLKNDVKALVQKITGQSGLPAGAAISAADKAYENDVVKEITASGRFGLAKETDTLAGVITEQRELIASQKNIIVEKDKALAEKEESLTAHKKNHAGELAKLNTEIKKLNEALGEEKKTRDKSVEQVQTNLESTREELQKDLIEKEKRLEEYVLEIAEKDKKIRRLEEELKRKAGKKTDIVNKADGQIEKIARNAGICYINVGKKDRIQPGMSFAVYSKKGVKKENVKGNIVVTNVSENFSECRIAKEDKDAPILVGDDVANLAYHPVRRHVFVVQGLFDLHGTGAPSQIGAEEVKEVIRKAGGVVSDEVGYQTDYVVLGEEPTKPVRPEADAPTSAQRAYQKQLRRYKEYQDIKTLAANMRIPILNTNRFVLMTGYEPEPGPE